MAEFRLIANDLPLEPEHLGESTIVIPQNTMVTIKADDIVKSSFPPYYQEQGYTIGDIKIVNHGLSKGNILDNPFNISVLYRDNNYMYYDANNVIQESEILAQEIEDGKFTAFGVNYGLDYVVFVARAINPTTKKQSNYSTVQGKLWIQVVPANNQPPSSVGDGYERFDLGIPKVFSVDMFTTKTTPQYQDPENDAAFSLKIIALPTIGKLTNKGVDCNVGNIVLMSEISLGLFKYHDLGNANLSSVVTFQYQINDVGSKIFVG